MSDEQNVQAQEPVVEQQEAGTAIPGEQQPNEIETRARAQGWVPKEEFRGPADKWRDAAEFVKRGEEELPILRERSRTLERRIADMERENSAKLARLERITTTALERQRADLEARYNAAMRDAVQTGDVQRFDQLQRDRAQAVDDFDKRVQPQQPDQSGLPPQIASAVQAWKQQNEWFDRDPQLNAAAQALHIGLNRDKPGMSLADNLAEVSRQVRQMFPEKFGVQRSDPAIVEGSGGRMATSTRKSPESTLTAEERRIGERFVKEGLFKNLGEYARDLQNA